MAKLVVLSEAQKGRSLDLNAERTTIGRLDDNSFQIPEQSVSSHHCEIILRSGEVIVKDLNSTNGTYVDGAQITEKILKPGQILRLGTIEMRLENGEGAAAAAKTAGQNRNLTHGGVKFGDTVPVSPVFDKNSPFAKKNNKITVVFITIGVVLFVVIVIFLIIGLKGLSS